jgi:hypothetical protein
MKGKQKNQMIEENGEEFEELSANSIDRLQEHGINVADINKLKAHGTNFYLGYNYWASLVAWRQLGSLYLSELFGRNWPRLFLVQILLGNKIFRTKI